MGALEIACLQGPQVYLFNNAYAPIPLALVFSREKLLLCGVSFQSCILRWLGAPVVKKLWGRVSLI